jgi:hypothetical protein
MSLKSWEEYYVARRLQKSIRLQFHTVFLSQVSGGRLDYCPSLGGEERSQNTFGRHERPGMVSPQSPQRPLRLDWSNLQPTNLIRQSRSDPSQGRLP